MALPRGFQIHLPFGEVGIAISLPIAIGTGGAKYKISVFGPEAKMKPAKYLYCFALRLVGFKKFFIYSQPPVNPLALNLVCTAPCLVPVFTSMAKLFSPLPSRFGLQYSKR